MCGCHQPATVSAQLTTGTTTVYAQPARLLGWQCTEGSGAATFTIYDNASAGSGTIIDTHATSGSNPTTQHDWFGPNGIAANKGLTVVITGTGATGFLYYSPL